jgi:CRP/FNR family transcriptional regulator
MPEEKNHFYEFFLHHYLFQDLNLIKPRKLNKNLSLERYQTNKLIFCDQNFTDDFYIIKSGVVQVMLSGQSQKRNVIDLLRPNDFFDEMTLFYHQITSGERYFYAYKECLILKIKKKFLKKLIYHYPQIKFRLHKSLCQKIFNLHNLLANSLFHNTTEKTAFILLYLNHKFGQKIDDHHYLIQLKVTHKLIGDFIGVTRESITKIMTVFKKLKIVMYIDKYTIIIVDIQKLKAMTLY